MKKLLFLSAVVVLLALISCNSQSDAQNKAKEISAVTEQASGQKQSESKGAWLRASIDGKKWEATKMGPFYGPESNYKLVSGGTNEISINFQLHKPTTGMKREFGNENVANFTADGELFSGKKGEISVTKVDEQWIEGTFYFSASSPDSPRKFEVTNGVFRIPVDYSKQ